MKKIVVSLVLCLMLLSGCGSSSKYSEPISLDFEGFKEKIENKESFALLVWRTGCSHCESFEPKLDKVIKDYDLEVYSIDTSKLSEKEYSVLENKTFVQGTPTTFIFKDGVKTDKMVGDKAETAIIEFFKNNNIIR